MISDGNYNRIYWRSRRGMLELDLLLIPFCEDRFRHLTEYQQQRYRNLLECEDQDLHSWLVKGVGPEDESFSEIIELILQHARSS